MSTPPDVPIYVINLDRDVDRLHWMDGQLTARGLAYTRVPAFTPATVPASMAGRFHERAHEVLLPNNIATFSSHLAIAERLLASDHACCLVLEDDVEIQCSAEELRTLAAECRKFDVLKLNDWAKCPTLEVGRAGRFHVVRYLHVPRGTGSYFLTRRGAARLLERAVSLAISTDNFFRAEAYSHLDIAGAVPPPIPQDRFGTSSLDPGNLRSRKRRSYFYGGQAESGAIARTLGLIRRVGVVNFARLVRAQVAMRARREGRDLQGRYILKAGEPVR